ncbi:MAG: gamma-glutamyl-gamma-aminobutyrate hydrolase family protein [Armatimonadota bacterium]|nr:gamma-glutamyl-gamma-aminobutyrate hydrolase family protein [Armatimonadota bacterium]MDR7427724.1 gamma-glutamyl-gamma-aminobutyrate hydrolase family protein [Armatimonadota bacterium]MDR7465510.1 gamma-glutamyl-gamma-aminobutyrate hydrolase family protein [Armatimonadota bacterium]MDR7469635.1 gamma-glutamyl-gamma-aminobutyrate hydrolase family protein [Armatimonadota bacterium]MDR7474934.1 gamma-glutamyl-gamma-aminobutyrate hydrolase family protein [Armatimonadota bacterium]
MARPVIGITVHTRTQPGQPPAVDVSAAAAQAIQAILDAGGLPIVLPPLEEAIPELMERLGGILLTGGGRLPPGTFMTGRPAPTLEAINPGRYAFERQLIRAAIARGIPLLGICRGMQMINETLGGRLIHNIVAALPHALQHYQRAPGWRPSHTISIAPDSRLAEIVGGMQAEVNSFHRQAVANPGSGLRVTALAPDGVVEAVESGSGFVLGVQFHPEKMVNRQARWRRIFRALVAAALVEGGS